jgi:hypothetical protein
MSSVLRIFSRLFQPTVLFAAASVFLVGPALADSGNSQGQGNPHVFRVVDRSGKFVGYSLTENLVAREINGLWVTFYLQPGVGIFDSSGIYLLYVTSDCSGTPYITHYSTFSEGTRVGPRLYYPVGTLDLAPRSFRLATGNGPEGACTPTPEVPGVYGVATTVNVDSFALEPPFRATQ